MNAAYKSGRDDHVCVVPVAYPGNLRGTGGWPSSLGQNYTVSCTKHCKIYFPVLSSCLSLGSGQDCTVWDAEQRKNAVTHEELPDPRKGF